MKVVHLNTHSASGGAAIAAKRHSEAMNKAGINSCLVSYEGKAGANVVLCGKKFSVKHFFAFAIQKAFRLIGYRVAWHWSLFDGKVYKLKEVQDADIVYLHWINDFVSYKSIDKLLQQKKRVVWYLHDMWPITGGCHYSMECNGYEQGCCECPQMRMAKWLASLQLNKKIRHWSRHDNFYLAAPSQWLCDCIQQSSVFKNHHIVCCRNVIDTDLFIPGDKKESRVALGLPTDKRIICFGAVGVNNPYKGFSYLLDVINKLQDSDYEFLVVGNIDIRVFSKNIQVKLHTTGFVSETSKMIQIYNAADVLIITSMAENFPNVVIEAMACGIPVVGFKTGGIKEQIKHKYNGYLVASKDAEELVKGIKWVLEKADMHALSTNAIQYVKQNCSYGVVLRNHRELLDI